MRSQCLKSKETLSALAGAGQGRIWVGWGLDPLLIVISAAAALKLIVPAWFKLDQNAAAFRRTDKKLINQLIFQP